MLFRHLDGGEFELFDMPDRGNSLHFFSLEVISSLLSIHLRKISRLSYSRERKEVKVCALGLRNSSVLISLNPIFTPASFP